MKSSAQVRRPAMRFCVRWIGVPLALLVMSTLLLGLFLNRAGLPDFIKSRLVAALRQQGWELEFSRLRWRWHRGLVAEDLQLERLRRTEGPQLFIAQAQCVIRHAALLRLDVVPTAIQFADGRAAWALERPGQPLRFIDLRAVSGHLRFNSDDTWNLDSLHATYRRLHLQINGTLTNASALRNWSFARAPKTGPGTIPLLNRIESIADQITLDGDPELEIVAHGDARTLQSFHAGVVLRAPASTRPGAPAGTACSPETSSLPARPTEPPAPRCGPASKTPGCPGLKLAA